MVIFPHPNLKIHFKSKCAIVNKDMLEEGKMEFADLLIIGGITVLALRFLVPLLLEFLGLPVTKITRKRDEDDGS